MKANSERNRFKQPILIWFIIFQIAVFFLGTTTVTGGTPNPNSPNSSDQFALNRRADVLKILAVLENRIEDRQLLEKTKKKLSTLND